MASAKYAVSAVSAVYTPRDLMPWVTIISSVFTKNQEKNIEYHSFDWYISAVQ